MLREVRENQPALALCLQVLGQRVQELTQHATLGVVDTTLYGRTRPRGYPGRVAHYEHRPPSGKEIRVHDFHLLRQPQALEVLASTCERTGIPVGGDHTSEAAAREHGGQHARPGANVKGYAGQ